MVRALSPSDWPGSSLEVTSHGDKMRKQRSERILQREGRKALPVSEDSAQYPFKFPINTPPPGTAHPSLSHMNSCTSFQRYIYSSGRDMESTLMFSERDWDPSVPVHMPRSVQELYVLTGKFSESWCMRHVWTKSAFRIPSLRQRIYDSNR